MLLTLAYLRRSSIVTNMTNLVVTLAPNLRRDRVSYVGMLESGLCKGVGVGRLREIASHLDVHGVDCYRWMAAAGHLPTPLLSALMRSPERWDEVTDLLGQPHRASQPPRSRRRMARSA